MFGQKKTPTATTPQASKSAGTQPRSSDTDKARQAAAQSNGRPTRSNANTEKSATLDPHLSFHGDLKFTGKVLIDCEFMGSVVTEDTLVIGTSGKLTGEIDAGIVEISGQVHGNIRASTSTKIFSGGEVHGDIETPQIAMEEGVVFEGNCTRLGSQARVEPRERSQSALPVQRSTPVTATA